MLISTDRILCRKYHWSTDFPTKRRTSICISRDHNHRMLWLVSPGYIVHPLVLSETEQNQGAEANGSELHEIGESRMVGFD